MTKEDLRRLSEQAREQATQCSRRGDVEGSFYNRGLRDAYAAAAAFVTDPGWVRELAR